jgi:hypothetical protein
MSGCGGGPVLVHGIRGGRHKWFAVGLIAVGPMEEKKQGASTEFDMIRLRRIDIIEADGTLRRHIAEGTGWLPA